MVPAWTREEDDRPAADSVRRTLNAARTRATTTRTPMSRRRCRRLLASLKRASTPDVDRLGRTCGSERHRCPVRPPVHGTTMTRSIVSVNAESADRRPDVQSSWMVRTWIERTRTATTLLPSVGLAHVEADRGPIQGRRRRAPDPGRTLLPAIEPVAARRLAPPDRGSDEPEQGEDHRHDPQDMEGETSPREDQHDEEQRGAGACRHCSHRTLRQTKKRKCAASGGAPALAGVDNLRV